MDNSLPEIVRQLREPIDFFNGKRLPKNFVLPDNILIFHHDFTVASPLSHQRYTLIIPNGQMSYLLDDSPVELKNGDVLLIPPGQTRYLMPDSPCYSRLFITFECALVSDYIPENNLGHFGQDSQEYLYKTVENFLGGKVMECAFELVKFLYSLKNVSRPVKRSDISPVVAKTLSLLNRHLDKVPDNDALARYLNISASHLRMIFRKEVGMSIGSYVAKQHLDIAKYHLRSNNMSISEIAEKCGYGSIYAFSAFFKKKTGLSPNAYRSRFVIEPQL